ncbi:MFS transporter [Amphibiibacter pelophylacis]|uniref:MFS transporter n=1 Tax=Amphibiibacter pelophylacis TaxID=1799477 RepID=A0ACC6P1C7_9BURK
MTSINAVQRLAGQAASSNGGQPTRTRFWIVAMLFLVTSINYGDRATLSIAGPSMAHDMELGSVGMGYVFSAFSWAYVLGQIPGGWLLDRFGSRRVYFWSIFTWSGFTLLQGFIGNVGDLSTAIVMLFLLRFMVGLAEAPSFPGNSRIVTAWFPAQERGTAASIFNSAQYFATVIFSPVMAWLVHAMGWQHVFFFMGGVGLIVSFVWLKVIHSPADHPRINAAELRYIEAGGGLVHLDQGAARSASQRINFDHVRQLLRSRMMVGIYLAQYCINALSYFFITWFPVYLVKQRGMSIMEAGFLASIPAICGFAGGVLGGMISDALLRRSGSLTFARKMPIIGGMLLSMVMVLCNYTDSQILVVTFMALAFFGKGVGALGWAVMADVAPREISGLSGGLFNMFGNLSGIVTPIVIGYIVAGSGSFNGALIYVVVHAFIAAAAYLLMVGKIERIQLASGLKG